MSDIRTDGERLIRELFADPEGFVAHERSYELLQAYFAGLALDTLRPLLKSLDENIQQAAVYVTSELGDRAHPLVRDVLPLAEARDIRTAFDAMETVFICSFSSDHDHFLAVLRGLERTERNLRTAVMDLVVRANESQLAAAREILQRSADEAIPSRTSHLRGLRLLKAEATDEEVRRAIFENDQLVRSYAAIAAKRRSSSVLLDTIIRSGDEDLRHFVAWTET